MHIRSQTASGTWQHSRRWESCTADLPQSSAFSLLHVQGRTFVFHPSRIAQSSYNTHSRTSVSPCPLRTLFHVSDVALRTKPRETGVSTDLSSAPLDARRSVHSPSARILRVISALKPVVYNHSRLWLPRCEACASKLPHLAILSPVAVVCGVIDTVTVRRPNTASHSRGQIQTVSSICCRKRSECASRCRRCTVPKELAGQAAARPA